MTAVLEKLELKFTVNKMDLYVYFVHFYWENPNPTCVQMRKRAILKQRSHIWTKHNEVLTQLIVHHTTL